MTLSMFVIATRHRVKLMGCGGQYFYADCAVCIEQAASGCGRAGYNDIVWQEHGQERSEGYGPGAYKDS